MDDLRERCFMCNQTLLSPDFDWAFYSCGHFVCPQCISSCSQNCLCGAGYYLPYLTIRTNEDLMNLICWCLTARETDQLHYRPGMEQLKTFISQSVPCPGCTFYISPFASCPNCPPDWMCPKCQAYSRGLSWECTNCQHYTNLDLVPDDFPLDELPEEKKTDPDSALNSVQVNSRLWQCRNCKYEYNQEAKCEHCDNRRDPPKIAPHQPASLPSQEGSISLSSKPGNKTVPSDQKLSAVDAKPASEEVKASSSKAHSKSVHRKKEQSPPPAPSNQTEEAKPQSRREWTCGCGMKNNCFAEKCQLCLKPKQGDSQPVEGEEAKIEPSREPWDCPSCTYKGVRGQKCQICGAKRPQPKSIPPASQQASPPANSIAGSSDAEAPCLECGEAQPCSCTLPSQSLPHKKENGRRKEGTNPARVAPATASMEGSRRTKTIPAKINTFGTQWACDCGFKGNMIGSTRCTKCKKAKKST